MKQIKTRLVLKHDSTQVWEEVNPDFVPFLGEVVIYDADANNPVPRVKIGDGVTRVADLPFTGGSSVQMITWEADD